MGLRALLNGLGDRLRPVDAAREGTVDYGPLAFDREAWARRRVSTRLYPWEGEQVVLLTTDNDRDAAVMARFLERLDAGWAYYADVLGRQPDPLKHLGGKATIAAVPDHTFTCGWGCGYLGSTGIEVAGFYSNDYPLVASDPDTFPDYYFYEMGRNFFVYGDRHSAFTTGFAVFMRYCCMDALGCRDSDPQTRVYIEQAEGRFVRSGLNFLQAFTCQAGMDEKTPRFPGAPGPTDQPVLYASAMLRMYRQFGEPWLRRVYRELLDVPQWTCNTLDGVHAQSIAWLVACAVAARTDLTPLFVDRWRLPLNAGVRRTLAAVDWADPRLRAAEVLGQMSSVG